MSEQTTEEIRVSVIKVAKRDIMDALDVLSDRDIQYDLWMNIKTPSMSLLAEDEHHLFDGLDRLIEKNKLENVFSSDLCKKLKQLKKVIRNNESKSLCFDKKNLDHPKMVEMRKLSSELFPIIKEELKQF